ncbi:MAG TPA: YciI family protein [Nannocystaceae bacterium]|nr:YciI family protein [Nannocystaceae bacterium]
MMLMVASNEGWKAFGTMSPDEIQRHVQFMQDVNRELERSGELVDARGLDLPDNAKIVHADDKGAPIVTDGPFAEAKEFLAGYWIVDVETPERAYAIAAHISTAPGRGGTPMRFPVQLRRVMSHAEEL